MSDHPEDRPVQPSEPDPYAYLDPVDLKQDVCAEVYRYRLDAPVRQFRDDIERTTLFTMSGVDDRHFINPFYPGVELSIHPLGDVFDVVFYTWYRDDPSVLDAFTQGYELLQRQYWYGEEMVDADDYGLANSDA